MYKKSILGGASEYFKKKQNYYQEKKCKKVNFQLKKKIFDSIKTIKIFKN